MTRTQIQMHSGGRGWDETVETDMAMIKENTQNTGSEKQNPRGDQLQNKRGHNRRKP